MNWLEYIIYQIKSFIQFCVCENKPLLETESERVTNSLYIEMEEPELAETKSNEEDVISYNYDQTEEDINAFLQGIMTNEEKRAYDRLVEVQHTLKPRISQLKKPTQLRTHIKGNKLTKIL